jgi:hypothetical protein
MNSINLRLIHYPSFITHYTIYLMKNLSYLFLTTCFLSINSLYASHSWGGEITYTCLGGNTYRFELVYYRDCAGITPTPITGLAISGCGLTDSVSITQIGGTTELYGLCPGASTCAVPAGTLPGAQKYVYQGIYTFANQCDDWKVSFWQPNRNAAITNIQDASSTDFYVEAHLNNLTVQGNSSPSFSSMPLSYTLEGQFTNFDFTALDPDGDEIIYSLISPMSYLMGSILFNPGYSTQQPMCSIPANTATLNTFTGHFSLTPCANQQAIFAVKATEYRVINGIRTAIGSIMRDMQVVVLASGSNANPIINAPTNILGNVGISTNGYFRVCPGSALSFHVRVADANLTDTLTVIMGSLPQGATATMTGSNPINVLFSWTPTANDVGQHNITLHTSDGYCPTRGTANDAYTIIVQGVKLQSNQVGFCKNIPTAIILDTYATIINGSTYTWSATPSPANFAPTSTTTNIATTIRETTTFRVLYTDNLCNTSDSITIEGHGGVEVSPSLVLFNPATGTTPIQATAVYPNPASPRLDTSGLAGTAHSCTGGSVGRTIGTGLQTTNTTGGVGTPFQGNWHDGRFQMLFTAAELQTAGLQPGRITKLALNITAKNSTIPYSNFTIKIGTTANTSLIASMGFLSNNSIVYTNAAYNTAVGTASFVLSSPYFWNGADNLVVEMCFDNTAFTSYDHVSFTPTTVTKALYQRIDGGVGCNLSAPTATANRPDIIFYNCPTAPQTVGLTYAWSSQSGTIANATMANAALTPTGILNTTDRFILTASDGTCTSSDTVLVLNAGACGLSAAIHENSFITCINTAAELDAATYSVGTGNLSYAWSTGETTPIIHTPSAGIYTVTVTAAGSPSCTNTATVNVVSHVNTISASISAMRNTLTCAHPSTLLTASPAGAYTYTWNVTLVPNQQVTISTAGTYAVTIADTATGCTASASLAIGQNNTTPYSIISSSNGDTITCSTSSILLNACTTPPNPNYTYYWSDGDTACAAHTCLYGGYYSVTITDNQNGCTSVASYNILENYSVNNNQAVMINAEASLLGCGHALLTVPNLAPNHIFLWNTGYTHDSLAANAYGTYTVTITSVHTGCTTSASYTYSPLTGTATETTVTTCNAATGAITAAMQAGIAPYQLSFDGSILTSSINYVYYITNVAAGAHLLTIQSTDGCQVNLPITTHCAQAVLQGIVFEDINSNGLLDATENPMPNQLIRAAQTGQTWYSVSDAQGVYSINLPSVGNDTLNAPNLSTWQTITTSPLTLTALLNDTVRTNIGIHTSPTPIDLSVQLVHENLRPGFAVPYYLYYKNTSTVIAHNVMLKLHLQGMTPNSFSCGYPHTVVNDTLIITIGDLPPSYFYNTAYVTIGIPTTTPLGLFVTSTLVIEPFTNDINSLNNTYTNYDITTGSIDPNDKHVNIEAYTFDRLSTGD